MMKSEALMRSLSKQSRRFLLSIFLDLKEEHKKLTQPMANL